MNNGQWVAGSEVRWAAGNAKICFMDAEAVCTICVWVITKWESPQCQNINRTDLSSGSYPECYILSLQPQLVEQKHGKCLLSCENTATLVVNFAVF